MGNNSVPKFIFRLSRFPLYRRSVLGKFYCIYTYICKIVKKVFKWSYFVGFTKKYKRKWTKYANVTLWTELINLLKVLWSSNSFLFFFFPLRNSVTSSYDYSQLGSASVFNKSFGDSQRVILSSARCLIWKPGIRVVYQGYETPIGIF
jgi:hypothetical protein